MARRIKHLRWFDHYRAIGYTIELGRSVPVEDELGPDAGHPESDPYGFE